MENAMQAVANGEISMKRAAHPAYNAEGQNIRPCDARKQSWSQALPFTWRGTGIDGASVYLCTCAKMGYGKMRERKYWALSEQLSICEKGICHTNIWWMVGLVQKWVKVTNLSGTWSDDKLWQYNSYFKLLGEVLDAKKLKHRPAQLYITVTSLEFH